MIKNLKCGFVVIFALLSFLLSACYTSHKLSTASNQHRKGRQPQFIDNISLGGNSNSVHTNVGGRSSKSKSWKEKEEEEKVEHLPACDKYAYMMGVVPAMLTNNALYKFIDEWYGVEYHLGGCDKSGVDCSGFSQKLYESVFGINLLRTSVEQFNSVKIKKGTDNLKEGDLVFFHTHGKKHISHVGIYLINNFFVHASTSQGVMISNLNEAYWQRTYAGAGHL